LQLVLHARGEDLWGRAWLHSRADSAGETARRRIVFR
jgi:hypothetical protein